MGFDGVMSMNDHDEYLSNLQATADRRLELLREIEEYAEFCPICHRNLVHETKGGHTDSCQLAEELSDGSR